MTPSPIFVVPALVTVTGRNPSTLAVCLSEITVL